MVDDPERRFGVQRFVAVAETIPALSNSRYLRWLRDFEDSDGSLQTYPVSALIAMLERGDRTSYLLCDLDLAAQLITDGIGLLYWYGYDDPNQRAWALDALSQQVTGATDIWCGDVMITTSGEEPADGNLGEATTPGTGFGIVCANLAPTTIDACERLGHDVARAYDQVTLPSGDRGGIEVTTAWR